MVVDVVRPWEMLSLGEAVKLMKNAIKSLKCKPSFTVSSSPVGRMGWMGVFVGLILARRLLKPGGMDINFISEHGSKRAQASAQTACQHKASKEPSMMLKLSPVLRVSHTALLLRKVASNT